LNNHHELCNLSKIITALEQETQKIRRTRNLK